MMRLAIAIAFLAPALAHADPLSTRFGWCIDAPDAKAATRSGLGSAEDTVLGKVESGELRVRKCRGTMAHYGDVAPATMLLWSDPKTKRVVRQVLGEDYSTCYELRAKGFKKSVVADPAPALEEPAKKKPKRCGSTEIWTFETGLRHFTSKRDPGARLTAFQTDLDAGELAFARGRLLDNLEDDPGLEWTKRFLEASHRIASAKWKAGAKADAAGIAIAALASAPFATEEREGRFFVLEGARPERRLWLAIDDWSIQVVNDLAFFAAEGGAPESALPFLKQVTAAEPARAVAFLNLGDASRDAGLADDARAAWSSYVKLMEKAGKKAKIPARMRKADTTPAAATDAKSLARGAIEKKKLEVARGWMRAASVGHEDVLSFQAAACATGEPDVIRAALNDPPVVLRPGEQPKEGLDVDDPAQRAISDCLQKIE